MGGPPAGGLRGGARLTRTGARAGEARSARIESLRALAALSVVVLHTELIALGARPELTAKTRVLLAGETTVYLFFALTGYLLYAPFTQRLGPGAARRPVDLGRYFLNRSLRILPLYYVMVAVLYALQPSGARGEDWWRFALFLEYTSEDTAGRLNGVLWTLVIEAQFYVLLPFLAIALARAARGSITRVAVILGILAAASLALRVDRVLAETIEPASPLGRNALPALFFFLAGGMLVALLRRHLELTGRRLPGSMGTWLLAAAALWIVAIGVREADILTLAACLATVGACVLPLRGGGGGLGRVLEWRPLAALGVATYSLYLWHGPVLLWVAGRPGNGEPMGYFALLVRGLPVVLAVAVVSYLVVERPFLRLRRRWGPTVEAAAPVPAPVRAGLRPASS